MILGLIIGLFTGSFLTVAAMAVTIIGKNGETDRAEKNIKGDTVSDEPKSAEAEK